MVRGGHIFFGAAIVAGLIALKLKLTLNTFSDAFEDGLSEEAFGDWPNGTALDEGFGLHDWNTSATEGTKS